MEALEQNTGYKGPAIRKFLGSYPATELPDVLDSLEELESLILCSRETLDSAELQHLSRINQFRREMKKLVA